MSRRSRFVRLFLTAVGSMVMLAAAGLAVVTQPLVRPIPSQPPQVDVQRIRAHVERLSVDFHPRSYDHPRQLERAAQYIHRPVALMLSLEMIGTFSDQPGSQRYPFPAMSHVYPDRGDYIAIVGKLGDFGATRRVKALMSGATALPVHSINAPPVLPGIDFSDHLSYWREGFPALMITDTAFMRNEHYHQPGETHDKLDYRRMAMVVQAVHAVTQRP